MADSPGTMTARTQASWSAVEEKLQVDVAIWKSEAAPESRPKEYHDLVEGASITLVHRGVASVSIGKLEWEVTPPSAYMGYCEKQEDWLLVSGSRFRVALRLPHGRGVFQVCPRSDALGVDDELINTLTRLFSAEETGTSASPTLRRTMSQKKRAEVTGKKLGPSFVKCVDDLQNATGVSEVLDTLVGFSAAYTSNQQVLQQVQEESDIEDSYFYERELTEEELRQFKAKRRSGSLWVRQQVRDTAMQCQVAAETTSEAAKLGVKMLLNKREESTMYVSPINACGYAFPLFQRGNGEETHSPLVVNTISDSETNKLIELFNKHKAMMKNSSSGLHLGNQRNDNPESGAANPSGSSLDIYLNESGDLDDGNNPPTAFLRTPSFGSDWQIGDIGNDTFSESSWDMLQAQTSDAATDAEDEDDVLGAGITDAESLDMMLRDRDPCGSSGCSNLINEYLSLHLSSASSTDQEQNVDGQETPRSSVLQRLASWSSSNSGWPDRDSQSDVPGSQEGPTPSVSTKTRIGQLETLAEEPVCNSENEKLCLNFVRNAAAKGDVLQWCSCKFNKSRSSVELKFQVGSFMEDDIATLSTGINRGSPLRIEMFLDPSNMRQSLLEGNVRISVDQGVSTEGTPSVVGLSCYIPHLVRQYLKHHILEQSTSGYEFPDGELLTGLMKHVVARLVFLKDSCCVCCHERRDNRDMITSFIPKPCEQNLCQALHETWLVIAPPMELEQSIVENWLRTCFTQYSDERHMLQYMDQPAEERVLRCGADYAVKLGMVAKWLQKTIARGSWLRMINDNKTKTDGQFAFGATKRRNNNESAAKGTPADSPSYRSGTTFVPPRTGLPPYRTGLPPYRTDLPPYGTGLQPYGTGLNPYETDNNSPDAYFRSISGGQK